ncbi:MAG: L-serine ammonia-lyase, iron-sulfur-dependent subunit beta [Oscillospiraceae bacterium]|nr:L-serine ammonia-lyase, iron-sulfur-dependent subunit beta [Oscillospiraceae bacterium]
MDIFDLIGPVMVGPSSSHTAGAARIGLVAGKLLGQRCLKAVLHLHGSFADTGKGHGTDKALIAGLMGMKPDDERIPDSFTYALTNGLEFEFHNTRLRNVHPNSVYMELWGVEGAKLTILASSIGGGRIQIKEISGMPLSFSAEYPTLIVRNEDQPGSVSDVSRVLAELHINIATFNVNRDSRGGKAIMVIECDSPIEEHIAARIREIPGILDAICINPD